MPGRMAWPLLAASLALTQAAAHGAREPRKLTLAEAVSLALHVDPLVAEAKTAEERSRLAVLRSQLDRVSVKIDGQLQELWNKTNIGGPTQYLCSLGGLEYGTTDRAACESLGGTVSTTEQSPQGGQGLFNLTASVTAPVFTGFRVTSTVRRAQRLRDAAQASIHQVRKDVAIAVARLYWSVRRIGLVAEVQQRALGRLAEAGKVVNARVLAGLAPPIDGNRAELQRLQQVAALADVHGQEREAAAQLAVNLGVSEDIVLIDLPPVPEKGPAAAAEMLRAARRPEIDVARWQLEAQRQAVRVAQSAYYPQLSLLGLFQYGNNPYVLGVGASATSSAVNPFANLSADLTLGARLTMNFFDMLNTYTAVRDAKHEEARLAAERRRWERVVEADVRQTHARLERLYARRAPLEQARRIAEDNVAILAARYGNGEALVIELLNAEVELTSAEQQLVDLETQMRLAWIELDAALGSVVGVQP